MNYYKSHHIDSPMTKGGEETTATLTESVSKADDIPVRPKGDLSFGCRRTLTRLKQLYKIRLCILPLPLLFVITSFLSRMRNSYQFLNLERDVCKNEILFSIVGEHVTQHNL